MTRTRFNRFATAFLACWIVVAAWPHAVLANDDFSNIVRYIESRYHVHRSYPFLMGLAGFAAKAWPGTGVKDVRIALFEDQPILQSAPDRELDELVQAAGNSGWRPLVKSFSRRSGNHSYIYAKPEGRDVTLLIVNVESSEAEIVQVKIDPKELQRLLNDHSARTQLAFN